MLRLASWNVNSLRVRLPQLLDWLAEYSPDIVGLQETKLQDDDFPFAEFEDSGYSAVCSGQKTYNGVAVLARRPLTLEEIDREFPQRDDPQRRMLAVTCANIRFINLYVPNGAAVGSDKFGYKLEWLDALIAYLKQQRKRYPRMVVAGDFNIAPEDRDVHDPEAWRGSVMVSEPEREKFQQISRLGFRDSFRLFEQPGASYSWWDYRAAAFRRNHGLRIDHILVDDDLSDKVISAGIDREMRKQERPSDHAPVTAVIDIPG